ncbi:MAG: glycosyltransferase [Gemmatimonadota bacterium]|jgi:hypothetical protein
MPDPELSVVMVTRDTAHTLSPILAALAEQTAVDRLEAVIVAPDREAGTPRPALVEAFAAWQVVPVGPVENRGRAAAPGVRAARAPVVALTENHCFPDPEWAEMTVRFHREKGWDGLGPSVENANPETTLSVCLHAAGYGLFPPGGEGGPREELPLHNSSFLKEALEDLDADLEYLMADERRLHATLTQRGRTLYFEPSVVKRHINEATWSLLGGLALDLGRRYGGLRAREWPLWRRVGYGMACPLLALPILRRQRSLLRSDAARNAEGPPIGLVQLAWSLCHAVGEGISYGLGPKSDFPFVENDEFMIRERLGAPLRDPRIRGFVERLDD